MSQKTDVIRRLMEEQDLTLEDLAERLKMSYTAVRNRVTGQTRIKPDEEDAWARALGKEPAAFRRMWQQSSLPLRTAEDPGIPIVNRAPAGAAWDFEKHGVTSRDGTAYTPRFPGEESDDFFAVEVVGESMVPELKPKDVVVLYPVAPGIPPQAIDKRIVLASFNEDSGGGVCLARIELTGDSDPHRGLQAKLIKLNPVHQQNNRNIFLTDLDNLAVAHRTVRRHD